MGSPTDQRNLLGRFINPITHFSRTHAGSLKEHVLLSKRDNPLQIKYGKDHFIDTSSIRKVVTDAASVVVRNRIITFRPANCAKL
jgi:hypothetical protein